MQNHRRWWIDEHRSILQAGITASLSGMSGVGEAYADYRKLSEHQKDIDGVVIATPDHTHAKDAGSRSWASTMWRNH